MKSLKVKEEVSEMPVVFSAQKSFRWFKIKSMGSGTVSSVWILKSEIPDIIDWLRKVDRENNS